MRLFHRKSKLERLIEGLESSELVRSTARTAIEAAVANGASPRQARKVGAALDSFDGGQKSKPGGIKRKFRTGIVLAAGAAAVTAASASISNLRHRENAS